MELGLGIGFDHSFYTGKNPGSGVPSHPSDTPESLYLTRGPGRVGGLGHPGVSGGNDTPYETRSLSPSGLEPTDPDPTLSFLDVRERTGLRETFR